MKKDMSVPCGDGFINLRVGAIIMRNGKILMVGNNIVPDYLYSVGGRLKFGETAEEAVSEKFMEGEHEEFLRWIDIEDPMPYFPEFFRTELLQPVDTVKYFLMDKR
ncbi:MAG: hypothetical protein E7277_07465 [Lachnospiraceae bacterium]|nr:hypothetical protein [Lachnospiraceae bacterium]